MAFNPIKSVDSNIFSNDQKKIMSEIKQTISYCRMLLTEIRKSNSDNEYKKKLIMEHMYIIYYCFKCIGIVKLTSNLDVNLADKEIEDYLDDFYSNIENLKLFENLKKKAKENKNKDEIYFYDNMIDKFINNKGLEIKKEIKKIQNEIYKNLENEENVKIPDKIQKYLQKVCDISGSINKDKKTIAMNRKLYYFFQKKIKDPNIRKEIENLYFSKSDKCLGLLEKLILLRSDYANKNGYKTYFDFVKRKESFNSEEIKNLMDDLIIKIDNRSKKETKRISRKLLEDKYKKKVEIHDFIYYHEEMCSDCFFSLNETIEILFDLVKKYFHIEFKKYNYQRQLWNNKIQTYQAFNSHNELLGYVYFDMSYNENKKVSSPMCIHMCHYYTDLNNDKYDTKVVIIGNYNDNEKCVTHADIVSLFKELGNAIQFLFYKTTTGNMNYRDDFYLLTSKIMEYIAWEKNTLMKLCHNDKELVDHLLFTRFIDFGNSIKLRCINAYFDHIIHNKPDLIKELKKSGRCSGEILKYIYQETYKNIFSSQKDFFNININLMHPVVILQEINGSETSIYENIIVEILSYSIFNLIKTKEGKKYTKILSKAGSGDFKELLNKFISTLGDNYSLYLQELIGYDEIDTELNMKIKNENSTHNSTDTGNFFDDKTGDQENIIMIDRKLELC
jgi:hypothetical protein